MAMPLFLHLDQHVDQRHLDLIRQLANGRQILEFFLEQIAQPQRDVGILGGVAAMRSSATRSIVIWFLPLPIRSAVANFPEVEQIEREPIDAVVHARGVDEERGDHGVHRRRRGRERPPAA